MAERAGIQVHYQQKPEETPRADANHIAETRFTPPPSVILSVMIAIVLIACGFGMLAVGAYWGKSTFNIRDMMRGPYIFMYQLPTFTARLLEFSGLGVGLIAIASLLTALFYYMAARNIELSRINGMRTSPQVGTLHWLMPVWRCYFYTSDLYLASASNIAYASRDWFTVPLTPLVRLWRFTGLIGLPCILLGITFLMTIPFQILIPGFSALVTLGCIILGISYLLQAILVLTIQNRLSARYKR